MYFIVLFFASFSFFFYENGTCEAHLEDAPVLPARSSGLPGKRAGWPTQSLVSSGQSARLCPLGMATGWARAAGQPSARSRRPATWPHFA